MIVQKQSPHMGGLFDDLVALPGKVIASQTSNITQAASGAASQVLAAGVAKAQTAIDQSSSRAIKNAMVAALLVAVVIGGAHVMWGLRDK